MSTLIKEKLKVSKFKSIEQEAMLSFFVSSNAVKNKFEEVCNAHGVSGSQFNVLRILKGVYPEGYARCEIISRMIDPSPDVTRLIDRLIKQGYVSRTKDDDDKRQSIAYITEEGINLLSKLNVAIEEFEGDIKKILTPEEINQLITICDKLYKIQE